jgi:hypothetical protein
MRINLAERLIYGSNKVMKKKANTVKDNIPKTYELFQNYPNPFNPVTTIDYSIHENSRVRMEIFGLTGNKVMTLLDSYKDAGNYSIKFNPSGLSSGIYIYTLRTENFFEAKKMVFLK